MENTQLSILNNVKHKLGIEREVTHFDTDIITDINYAIMKLMQIGIGPDKGYAIHSSSETWVDFIGERLDCEGIKTYIYLQTKLLFDPPSSAYVTESIKEELKEMLWRLNTQYELTKEGEI